MGLFGGRRWSSRVRPTGEGGERVLSEASSVHASPYNPPPPHTGHLREVRLCDDKYRGPPLQVPALPSCVAIPLSLSFSVSHWGVIQHLALGGFHDNKCEVLSVEPGAAWPLAGESFSTVASPPRTSRLGRLLPVLQAPESHLSAAGSKTGWRLRAPKA